MVKAAIFDMDGLLIGSEPFWRQSHVNVLGRYGYQITEEDARQGAGKRTPDQVLLWQQRFKWQDLSNDDLANEIVANVKELIALRGEALPGVYKVVNLMANHKIPMAVASSSSIKLIEIVLDKLQLNNYIKIIQSAENERRGKPFPDVFLSTAKKLKVKPASCVVFEDSPTGIQAAKAAGMKCIAVPEQFNMELDYGADLAVESLEKLEWEDIQGL